MITKSPYLEAPRRLRAFVRAHETSLVILAAVRLNTHRLIDNLRVRLIDRH